MVIVFRCPVALMGVLYCLHSCEPFQLSPHEYEQNFFGFAVCWATQTIMLKMIDHILIIHNHNQEKWGKGELSIAQMGFLDP